jgi:hypothetical protein
MATSVPSHVSSEMLEVNAEIQRLGKLLNIAHAELHYLRGLSSAELHALRAQVTSSLYDNQTVLIKMAAASKILPVALLAQIAEKVFGPMLAARIAGLVEPDRAVEIAARVSVPFLTDVATELDPRRVAAILAKIPPATVAAVTKQLVAREEWVAMGAFYGYLPAVSIRAAIQQADAHALLQISLVLDDKSRLAGVLDIAGMETLEEIGAAAEAEGLTDQLRALSVYLTPEQQAQLPA